MAELAQSRMSSSGGEVPAPTSHVRLTYLHAWRLHRLMSQSQLSKAAGVSKPTIIRGERGDPIYELNAAKLARALGVTIEQLQDEKPQ